MRLERSGACDHYSGQTLPCVVSTFLGLAHADLSHAFGLVLRERREAAKLSQEELAHRAGLTRNYVGLLERGRRNPTLNSMASLAEAMKVSLQALIADLDV